MLVRRVTAPVLAFAAVACAASECPPVDNLDAVAGRKVVILGEMHGTREGPRFVSALACRLLAAGKPVVLAVEMDTKFQGALDAAMASEEEGAATAKLEALSWFDATLQDGKRSVAWLEMLKSAWRLRREHPGFTLVAIDAGGVEREGSMAREIRLAALAHPAATLLVFIGNANSRRKKGLPWKADFVPAAAMLGDLDVVSLEMSHAGGKVWNCGRNGCGVHEVTPDGGAPRAAAAIRLGTTATSHDGTFDVGEVTASLPLRTPK